MVEHPRRAEARSSGQPRTARYRPGTPGYYAWGSPMLKTWVRTVASTFGSRPRLAHFSNSTCASMAAHYEAAVAGMVAAEIKVRETLNTCGVNTINYVPYLNFGRQLYKLTTGRQIAGDSAIIEAQVLLEKWAKRGLDPDVLATVRTQVFNIGPPPA